MYGIDGMKLGGANGYEQADRNPITKEEIQKAHDTLKIGKVIEVYDYRLNDDKRLNCTKQSEISYFNDRIIQFTNGLSATVKEYARYLRDPHYPLGWHWS